MTDVGIAVAYIESAALNVMRCTCTDDQKANCARCLAGAQLAKALEALSYA